MQKYRLQRKNLKLYSYQLSLSKLLFEKIFVLLKKNIYAFCIFSHKVKFTVIFQGKFCMYYFLSLT